MSSTWKTESPLFF